MLKNYILLVSVFILGILIGAIFFHDTKSRNIIPYVTCKSDCFTEDEIVGLITSVLVQKIPVILPQVVAETDKAIAIKSPVPQSPIHYVIFPKKDIKNIAEVSEEDNEYLNDIYAIISELVDRDNLVNYQVITNGPGYQHTNYLHFHLKSEKTK
jgi:histidine triad (HIT) family protein